VKPFLPQELVARVKAVLRRSGNQAGDRAVIKAGDLAIDVHGHRVTHRGKELSLTAAEFRILEFLASHAGRAFSRDEIIEAAFRSESDVTERTVDAHIVGIRKALGAAGSNVETVRSVGYRFQAGGE
jgi:DNA-binding response OmpR family regulator